MRAVLEELPLKRVVDPRPVAPVGGHEGDLDRRWGRGGEHHIDDARPCDAGGQIDELFILRPKCRNGVIPRRQVDSQRRGRLRIGHLSGGPRNRPDQRVRNHRSARAGDAAEGDRIDRGRGGFGRHRHQCRGQFVGILGGQELPARLGGDALHLRQRFGVGPDVEANHMGGEIDARLLQQPGRRARVGIAGLDPVGDEDDGGLLLGVAQGVGRSDHRIGHRRLAQGLDATHRVGNGRARTGARGDDGLDIAAIAPFAVAVNRQPQRLILGDRAQKPPHHILGDGDLRRAVDLAPHRPRSVQHQDGVRPVLILGQRRQRQNKGKQNGENTHRGPQSSFNMKSILHRLGPSANRPCIAGTAEDHADILRCPRIDPSVWGAVVYRAGPNGPPD